MKKSTFVALFTLFFGLGLVGLADYLAPKVKTYRVCFYDAIERRPDCNLMVKAKSFELVSGCAKFSPGEETICGILMIASDPAK